MFKSVVLACCWFTVLTFSSPVDDPKGILPKPNVVIGTFIGRMVNQDIITGILPEGGLQEFNGNLAKEENVIKEPTFSSLAKEEDRIKDNLIFT